MSARRAARPATILTDNITPGKQGARITQERYDHARKAILAALGRSRAGLTIPELSAEVARRVPADLLPASGSGTWLTMTVKLDLEAKGLIERVPGSRPQHLRRT